MILFVKHTFFIETQSKISRRQELRENSAKIKIQAIFQSEGYVWEDQRCALQEERSYKKLHKVHAKIRQGIYSRFPVFGVHMYVAYVVCYILSLSEKHLFPIREINESLQLGKLKEELSMKTTEAEVLKKRLQQMVSSVFPLHNSMVVISWFSYYW